MAAVTLPAVKAFLNIAGTGNDAELLDMVERAEAILSRRVGPLAPTTITDERHTGPGPIVLRHWPVISVASASTGYGAVVDVELDDAGVLYGSFSSRIHRDVRVTYVAGRDPLPLDLEQAVLEMVQHLWTSQRVPGSGRRGFTQGDPDERALQGVSTYLLPYRVQTLIDPHLIRSLA